MAIDPSQIVLSPAQQLRLASLAESEGNDCVEVIDELLDSRATDADASAPPSAPVSAYDAFDAVGAIGCSDGPTDLSTNPRHMEGFGSNGAASRDAD